MAVVSIPAGLSIAAGVLLLTILPFLWIHREEVPVHGALMVIIFAAASWSLSYGVALTVLDPWLRRVMEIPIWFSRTLLTVGVLLGGLRYTGHDEVVPSWVTVGVVAAIASTWILHVTNALGYHDWMWSDYIVVTVYGAAGVDYNPGSMLMLSVAAAYVIFGFVMLAALSPGLHYGWLDTIYRSHFGVIVLASIPPAAANLLWFVGLWGIPQGAPYAGLDLTPPAFLLSGVVLVAMVALRGDDIVEVTPADRRRADDALVDDLETGVVAVDEDLHVLRINEAAATVLDVDRRRAFGRRIDSLSDGVVRPPFDEARTVSFPTEPSRIYELSSTEIDGDGSRNGYVVTLTDVTRRLRRQQRLEVLNRVLRHNLRHDIMVVEGKVQAVKDEVESVPEHDGDVQSVIKAHVDDIFDRTGELMREADRAREVADALPGEDDRYTVNVKEAVDEVVTQIEESFPNVDFEVDIEEGLSLQTNPDLLRIALENLVDNACRHGGDLPRVKVVAKHVTQSSGAGPSTEISVVDGGPGLPEQEIEVLERGTESSTVHGSGIGLWTVKWCVNDMGGSLDFEVDDGTHVTLTLPNLSEKAV